MTKSHNQNNKTKQILLLKNRLIIGSSLDSFRYLKLSDVDIMFPNNDMDFRFPSMVALLYQT